MYRLINSIKTGMLLAALMVIFVIAGRYIGGRNGMIVALLMGGAMNAVAYFYSDRIALMTMGARPLPEREAPDIYHILRDLAGRASLPMPRVYLAPAEIPNAFATGRNPRHAVVCLTEGIVRLLDRDELAGVIAHELAHIKHYDVLISTVAATLAGAISSLSYMLYFVPIGRSDDEEGANPLVGLAMLLLAPIAAGLIQMSISRKREYNADHYAARLWGNPMPLATALEKLHYGNQESPMNLTNPAQASLFIVKPFSGGSLLNLLSTHPSVERRVQALIGRPRTGRLYGQSR